MVVRHGRCYNFCAASCGKSSQELKGIDTIKVVLAPLFGTDGDASSLEAAFLVAQEFARHVRGIYVPPDITREVLGVHSAAESTSVAHLIREAHGEALENSERLGRKFADAASAAGATFGSSSAKSKGLSASWEGSTEDRSAGLVESALTSDLAVFTRRDWLESPQIRSRLESVLFSAGRPVLLMPPTALGTMFRHVGIAWNSSPNCGHAVTSALPILHRAASVRVISVNAALTRLAPAEQLTEYLAWHEISADFDIIAPEHESVGETLFRRVAELGCEMLVMGAYGHSRFRELVLGGVTRYTLDHASIPVLMAH